MEQNYIRDNLSKLLLFFCLLLLFFFFVFFIKWKGIGTSQGGGAASLCKTTASGGSKTGGPGPRSPILGAGGQPSPGRSRLICFQFELSIYFDKNEMAEWLAENSTVTWAFASSVESSWDEQESVTSNWNTRYRLHVEL